MNDDSDEMLGPDKLLSARLDEALRSGLDSDGVDVATLLHGSRHRARQIRTQRFVALSAAAALVVAVPVGYEVINSHPGDNAPPAAMLPSSSGSGFARTLPSPATPVPISPTDVPRGTPPPVLDSFGFTADELPRGVTRVDLGQLENPGWTLVSGQDCAPATAATPVGATTARPLAGRRWVWKDPAGPSKGRTISLTVTDWIPGRDAATAFEAAVDDSGVCRWSGPQTEHDLPAAVPAEQRWAATSTEARGHYGRALLRTGDKIVGIEVSDPAGLAPAARLLDALAAVQAERLRGSGQIH